MEKVSFSENLERSILINQNAIEPVRGHDEAITEGIQGYGGGLSCDDNSYSDGKLRMAWFEGWLWAASIAKRWGG